MNHETHESHESHEKILYRQESFAIQGAAFQVYREMGNGFLESVYQECLEKEFRICSIPFQSQPEVKLSYKGEVLMQTFRPDFICYGKIIVELKAVKEIAPEHKAQTFNYLKATGFRLGLIMNFGHYPKLEVLRIIL